MADSRLAVHHLQFVDTSAKYQAPRPIQLALVDVIVNAGCQALTQIGPQLRAASSRPARPG